MDKSGALNGGETGTVIIKGSDVALEGVGDTGRIVSRAPIIHQKAVNPGIDGRENVVCGMSEIVSQACDIVLHSSDAKDEFSQVPLHAGRGGISLHADKRFNIEAAVSAERRKKQRLGCSEQGTEAECGSPEEGGGRCLEGHDQAG